MLYNHSHVVQLTNIHIMYMSDWGYRIIIIKEKRSVQNTHYSHFTSVSFCRHSPEVAYVKPIIKIRWEMKV